MAAANRFRRVRSQLPSCYYEGFLEKKSIKDQVSQCVYVAYTYDDICVHY